MTCLGRPGSDSHEQKDADLWASFGVDYLKEDSCGGTTHGTVWEQYALMRDALNRTGTITIRTRFGPERHPLPPLTTATTQQR